MKKTILHRIAPLAAAALLAAPLSADRAGSAVSPPPAPAAGRRHNPVAVLRHCLRVVNPTQDQTAAIQQILSDAKPALQSLHDNLKADRETLKAALQGDSPDPCALGNDLLAVKSDRDAIRGELEGVKSAVEDVLTADQKSRFEGCVAGMLSAGPPDSAPPDGAPGSN
jgi:Spy/CpxP family protein refolding chaperone